MAVTYPIPLKVLDYDRLAIVGTAGSGKTYTAMTAVEALLRRGARVGIVDPLGVWWGLRLNSDGKTPSPYDIVIFGGPHGDVPIHEHAGAVIGEAVATMKESFIIDLSDIGTKAAERRFMYAFATALYKHTNKSPLHLVFDEADMWAPQRLLDKEGDAAKLLGQMETLVRRGRVRGFVPWLITQRPAVLSWNVLSMAEGVIAMKLTSHLDRAAIGRWLEGQTKTKGDAKVILDAMPTLARGEGVTWLPSADILKTIQYPAKETFDSSRTPKRGEAVRKAGKLKALNIDAITKKLKAVVEEQKANDPKALKAEIARLRAEGAKASAKEKIVERAVPNHAAVAAAYQRGVDDAFKTIEPKIAQSIKLLADGITSQLTAVKITFPKVPVPKDLIKISAAPDHARTRSVSAAPAISVPKRQSSSAGSGGDGPLPPGEKAVLIAAAQFGNVERDQLSVLTGYKRSSRDAYIARLQQKQYITVDGRTITPTQSGVDALGSDYEPLPQGADLQRYWLSRLPEGEKKVLEVLLSAYPESVAREHIDDVTGYKRSSRDAYLARMKQKRIVESRGSHVIASEALFG